MFWTLTKLKVVGNRWYATLQDGNMTSTDPTGWYDDMTEEQVVEQIKIHFPDIEIALQSE